MAGFWKSLLSSSDIIKGGMSALDKAVLTAEESKDLKIAFVKATMPMNRTRRLVTLFVVPIWATHAFLGTYLLLAESPLFVSYMSYMTTNITAPFALIVGFYFFNERYGSGK